MQTALAPILRDMLVRYQQTAIRQTGKLESDTEEQLKAALNELLDQFNPQV